MRHRRAVRSSACFCRTLTKSGQRSAGRPYREQSPSPSTTRWRKKGDNTKRPGDKEGWPSCSRSPSTSRERSATRRSTWLRRRRCDAADLRAWLAGAVDQLAPPAAVFAALGFRCIAPDMRGYGRSSVYPRHEDYALEHSVRDMIELLDALGRDKAVWVGHDWGSPVVWSLASHHPERCLGVANLCVPYIPGGFAPADSSRWSIARSIRKRVPGRPMGIPAVLRGEFRQGAVPRSRRTCRHGEGAVPQGQPRRQRPAVAHRPGAPGRRLVRRRRPRAGVPRDPDVLTEEDLSCYVASLQRNGFFGPDSWYMNAARNIAFARQAPNGGRIYDAGAVPARRL